MSLPSTTDPACAPGGSGSKTCKTCSITSQTVATQPADRTRKRIGVGEEVKLTFSLGVAHWTVAGKGFLSTDTGATVSYSAPDVAGTDVITATGSGCTATIQFTIVAPASVHMDRVTAVWHYKDLPTVGMGTNIYIGPDDVSFYNIRFRELEVGATASGIYDCKNGTGHHPNANSLPASTTVTAGKGTRMNAHDNCYSGYCEPWPPDGWLAQFMPRGTINWPIPWEYQVTVIGTFHAIQNVNQTVLCSPPGLLAIAKAGAQGQTTIDAAEVAKGTF